MIYTTEKTVVDDDEKKMLVSKSAIQLNYVVSVSDGEVKLSMDEHSESCWATEGELAGLDITTAREPSSMKRGLPASSERTGWRSYAKVLGHDIGRACAVMHDGNGPRVHFSADDTLSTVLPGKYIAVVDRSWPRCRAAAPSCIHNLMLPIQIFPRLIPYSVFLLVCSRPSSWQNLGAAVTLPSTRRALCVLPPRPSLPPQLRLIKTSRPLSPGFMSISPSPTAGATRGPTARPQQLGGLSKSLISLLEAVC